MSALSELTIDRARVREVTGVFHSRKALQDAAEMLMLSGFDRADVDVVASIDEVRDRLGVYVAAEELPDVPVVPRRPLIAREDITVPMATGVVLFGFAAAAAAAYSIIASGGESWSAAIAAALAGSCAGAVTALLAVRLSGGQRAMSLEPLMAERGLILWVRVRSPDREDAALKILQDHGAQAVRAHEIEIEKRVEDLPLGSLGDERLGRP